MKNKKTVQRMKRISKWAPPFFKVAPLNPVEPLIIGEQITEVDENGQLQRPFVLQINPYYKKANK